MAKRSKQTFRKRQRELAKKRKKEAKAERLAARRAGEKTGEEEEAAIEDDEKVSDSRMTGEGKILKIRLVGSKNDG